MQAIGGIRGIIPGTSDLRTAGDSTLVEEWGEDIITADRGAPEPADDPVTARNERKKIRMPYRMVAQGRKVDPIPNEPDGPHRRI